MSATMTLRERIATALKGGMPDRVPFTSYGALLPVGRPRRRLRDLGLAVFNRIPPYRLRRPNVVVERQEIPAQEYRTILTTHRTPVGTLTEKQVVEPGYGSLWTRDYLVKRPEDYAVLEFIVRDENHDPDIDGFLEKDRANGDTGMAVPRAADPPVQELWRHYTGLERFALDWYDCRQEVRRVLDAMAERNRRIWDIVADTPGDFCASGGNISGDTIGPSMFDELIMPHFQAEAQIMHAAGKRLVNHMDGMMKSLTSAVARCPVDVIEAFNPSPDGNLSVAEARAAWPDKALAINFPSSVHLQPLDQVRNTTIDLLRQAVPGNGFVIGITENVPLNVVENTLTAIAETLNRHGECPLSGV